MIIEIILIVTHDGTTQVKKVRTDLLNSQYDSFYMLDSESINDMLTWFTTITNGLISLYKPINNDQKVRKIVRALFKSWEVKAITLNELNDKEEMNFTTFMSNLKIYEMKMKARDERESPKKTSVHSRPSQESTRRNVHTSHLVG